MLNRWSRPGGYKEVLKVAYPLILSTGSWSIQHFVDRMFLSWYSQDALAASLPAGMLQFTFISFFFGTAAYVNTFVAQYVGAGRENRVGPAVWSGIYFGLVAGLIILSLRPFAHYFFEWAGHDPSVRVLETEYFRILCISGLGIPGIALSAFFTGRGKTLVVMWANFAATGINLLLDYAWIFGNWGFPEWGISGAAWATVVAHFVTPIVFFVLVMRRKYDAVYCTRSGWRPDWDLVRRLIRFGVPNGIQFMLEILGFSVFIMLVGMLGTVSLAATNIAFNINTLAFLPMLGIGTAVSTLVGQHIGNNRPDIAERTTWSAVHLTLIYMGTMAAGYSLVPHLFLRPFSAKADPETFSEVWEMCVVLLRFIAVYSVFDGMYIVFSAGVKGAGDTRFVMYVSTLMSWTIMVIPTYLSVAVYGWGLFTAWIFVTVYIVLAGTMFMLRFMGGKWKTMRVIEAVAPVVAPVAEDPDVGMV
jgi:multidrug resistance protein, MATE family